jgi:hypothetical protein
MRSHQASATCRFPVHVRARNLAFLPRRASVKTVGGICAKA